MMKKKKNSFDNLDFAGIIRLEDILPLMPETLQLVDIFGMKLIDVSIVGDGLGGGKTDDLDGATDDDIDGIPIGQETDIVIEDASSVEEWNGEAQAFLDEELKVMDEGVRGRRELIVEIVFAKG